MWLPRPVAAANRGYCCTMRYSPLYGSHPVKTASISRGCVERIAGASDSGDVATRGSTSSIMWADAKFALKHLPPSLAHWRRPLEQIRDLTQPKVETRTRKEQGRVIREGRQMAQELLDAAGA